MRVSHISSFFSLLNCRYKPNEGLSHLFALSDFPPFINAMTPVDFGEPVTTHWVLGDLSVDVGLECERIVGHSKNATIPWIQPLLHVAYKTILESADPNTHALGLAFRRHQ